MDFSRSLGRPNEAAESTAFHRNDNDDGDDNYSSSKGEFDRLFSPAPEKTRATTTTMTTTSPRRAASPTVRTRGLGLTLMGVHAASPSKDEVESGPFEDDVDEEHLSSLGEGSFSFIIAAPFLSVPMFTAIFVFFLETALFLLIAIKLRQNDPNNPLGFPASVEATVILAQFFALLIAVCTQDDVVSALSLIYEGYHADSMKDAFPHTSFWRWLTTVILMMTTGVFGLAVTFLLIVTSSDVVEVLLNFTAVEFISLLDNGTFLLGQQGFLGHPNKVMADTILNTRYEIPPHRRKSNSLQICMLILSYIVMVIGWSIIYAQQLQGIYTPNTLIVQFEDELDYDFGIYSGLYELRIQKTNFGFGRNRYVGTDGVGMFGYCTQENAWTFSINPNDHPCDNFIAHSDDNQDFDITTTADFPWFITGNPDSERFYPMQNFHLAVGCVQDVDCGGVFYDEADNPIPKGVCSKNRCQCREPYFGWRCDFDSEDTCTDVEADTFLANSFEGNKNYALSFSRLQDANGKVVRIYEHAVWLSELNAAGEGDIIFYTGLRWGLFTLPTSLQDANITTRADLASYFTSGFTALDVQDQFLRSTEYFLSDVVEFNTPNDESTPVGLGWLRVGRSNDILSVRQYDATLLCAICNDQSNPCANANPCVNGTCECNNGASGTLCRITPVNDGNCNEGFFNDAPFAYDGGDCCEFSCVSSEFQCGITIINQTETIPTQFPNCVDPTAQCAVEKESEQCWSANSQPLPTETATTLTVSANGRVIVQSLPSSERVKVFDQLDSIWTQRGVDLSDVRGSQFGVRIGVSTPPHDVRSSIDNLGVRVVVAAGLYRQSLAGAKVYFWNTDQWTQIGGELRICSAACVLDSIDIGNTGESATLVTATDRTTVSVYHATFNETTTSPWNLVQTVAGLRASVSGDGKTLAVSSNTTMTIYSISPTALQVINQGQLADLEKMDSMQLSYRGDFLTYVTQDVVDAVWTVNLTKPLSTRQRFTTSTVGPLSDVANRAGFIPASISSDASSVVVMVDTPNGPIVRTWNYFATTGWRRAGSDFRGIRVDSAFGTSGEGEVLAVIANGTLIVSSLSPLCPGNGVSFRLAIPLDSSPVSTSWSLKSFVTFGQNSRTLVTGTVDKECKNCYTDQTNFGSTLINVEGCISRDECLEFRYRDDDTSGGATPFYLFKNKTLVDQRFIGSTREQSYILEKVGGGGCQLTDSTCGLANESSFLLQLTLDHEMEETFWKFRDDNNTLLAEGGGYNRNSVPVNFERACVVSNTSRCYDFEIFDRGGDGSCCEVGEGGYTLFWEGREIISRKGDSYKFGERVQFGSCNTAVFPASSLRVTVFADPNPGNTTWYLEDDAGKQFVNSRGITYSQDVNRTDQFFLFEADITGCLNFMMEDSAGDGNSGYSVEWNGIEVIQRDGGFRFWERTSICVGQCSNGTCPTRVTLSSSISIEIQLGGNPTETTWYIGDVSGSPLNGTTTEIIANETSAVVSYDPVQQGNPANCYTFTITDLAGDGNGGYSILLGLENITSSAGDFGFGHRVRFGRGCPTLVETFSAFKVTVDINLDNRPNETGWRVVEVDGTILAQETYQADTPTTSSVIRDLFHFPESPEDECLFFFIEDAGGDGLCCQPSPSLTIGAFVEGPNQNPLNESLLSNSTIVAPTNQQLSTDGNYTLSVNDQIVYAGAGDFGALERVRFGRSCNLMIGQLAVLTVNITLDTKPNETSWDLLDTSTNRLVARASNYSNSSETVVEDVLVVSQNPYVFTIYDSAGDGLCCSFGSGSFIIVANQDTVLVQDDGQFGSNSSYVITAP